MKVRKNEKVIFHKDFLNMDGMDGSLFYIKLSNFQHVFMSYRCREACLNILI